MARRISFSGQNNSLEQVAEHHRDVEDGLRGLFSPSSPQYEVRFTSYQPAEVVDELNARFNEADRQSTINLLAAVEAAFRIDYLQHCYDRGRDDVSRMFRDLHKQKDARARLEDDILEVWKISRPHSGTLIGHLRGAFRYRHWMAHGRYWTPKLGAKYDFLTVYGLAHQALQEFSLSV